MSASNDGQDTDQAKCDPLRRYLIVLNLGEASPQRLIGLVPAYLAALGRLSLVPTEQAFHSATRELCGYFITSRLAPKQIIAALESPARGSIQGGMDMASTPFLNSKDALMVLELGEAFLAGVGFTRAGTWLQRHPKSQ